jgi:hypothetical protein
MPNSHAPFIITQLQNKTDQLLELFITSFDNAFQQKIFLARHEVYDIALPFGRSENFKHQIGYPVGYSINTLGSNIPFKLLSLSYTKTESPYHDAFRFRKRFVHYWTLQVDGEEVALYQAPERTSSSYRLVIEPQRVYAEIAGL